MVKRRSGFVSNSSSTSFVIYNKTNERLGLEEFVKENPQVVEQYQKEYEIYDEYKVEHLINIMVNEANNSFNAHHRRSTMMTTLTRW